MFEIRKNLDLRKILVTPKIFLKSRFHCTGNKVPYWDTILVIKYIEGEEKKSTLDLISK